MTRLILAGAGYTHLFVLEAAAQGGLGEVQLIVVSGEESLGFAGMLPGVVAGRLPPAAATIDLRRLVERARGRFVHGRIRRIDPDLREVLLESGEKLGYDLLSLSLPGAPSGLELPGVSQFAQFPHTLEGAVALGRALDHAAKLEAPEPLRVVVAGGSTSGVDLALAARARLDQQGAGLAAVTLLEPGHTVLPEGSAKAQAEARLMLRAADITLRPSTAVAEAAVGHLKLVNNGLLPVDLLIWATSTLPPSLYRDSGLITESHGFLLVDETLRLPRQSRILASGDGVVLEAWQVARRSTASAIRQGRVLTANLAALIADPDSTRGLRRFKPRWRAPSMLAASEGQAILSFDRLAVRGSWVLKLKDRLDRRFVRRFAT